MYVRECIGECVSMGLRVCEFMVEYVNSCVRVRERLDEFLSEFGQLWNCMGEFYACVRMRAHVCVREYACVRKYAVVNIRVSASKNLLISSWCKYAYVYTSACMRVKVFVFKYKYVHDQVCK